MFDFQPSIYTGCPYVEQDRIKPGRWKGKQLEGHVPKKTPSHNKGVPSNVSADCVFGYNKANPNDGQAAFIRMFEKDGWSGDVKEPGWLNGRAAYTNTVNTERYRETMRKEERIVAGRSDSMARQSLESLTERRRESAGAKADELDRMVQDRKYKPTSQGLGIGQKLHMAASCNPQNYLPPIPLQGGGTMPAAYRCPHAHRRSALTEKSWFV